MVKRRFPRYPTTLSCLYSKNGGPDWNGTAINLSRGGCAMRGTTPVQEGDALRVLIFPSVNQSPLEVEPTVVRWTNGAQFGVEFVTLTPRDAQRLQTYLTLMESEAEST
jgi:hypothetical protein